MAKYAAEAKAAMDAESQRRIAETTNPEEEERLRNMSLYDLINSEYLVPSLLSRLGTVRAALDGHGGGIAVTRFAKSDRGLDIVLDLTGACLSCGAAPGTLAGVKTDLENDTEINSIKFSSALLDTFDELGREFILAHGKVEFVDA